MSIPNKKYSLLTPLPMEPPPVTGHDVPRVVSKGKDCCSGDAHVKEAAASNETTGSDHHDHDHAHEGAITYWPAIVSLLLLLAGIGLDYAKTEWFNGYLRIATYGIAYLLTGWKVISQAVENMVKGSVFNEFTLMTLATFGAFYLGEYAEGVAVMLFYVIGEHFQEAAVARSRKSIRTLIDNRPTVVGLLQNGKVIPADPHQVKIGDVIQVKAGEKVALDGKLLSDSASFDMAALTGESRPDTKGQGDAVLAGMINGNQVVDLQVTSTYDNSALAKILQLVEQAGTRKAKTQQFISRFAKVYTPVVVLLALALTFLPYFFTETYVFNQWLYRALIFLVISCPCALMVSIPLGYFGGIGAASRNGVLFKGSSYLDLITKVNCVVMDKTGTLTKGVFKVQHLQVADGFDRQTVLTLAATLEGKSAHPVANAIVAYSGALPASVEVAEVHELPGSGIKGKVQGKVVLVGNARLLRQYAIPFDPQIEKQADTTALVAVEGRFAGYFIMGDELKSDAGKAVRDLRALGVSQLVMLSGDKESIVQQTAEALQLDQAYGELLPQDKVARVEELKRQGKTVAFVGDGINDAPVITLADVGIAMGGLGSDAAIETADVVIQTDQPAKIATAIRIGRQTKNIVWQNIGLAFGVKVLVLSLGAFGVASMWEAVFADVGVAFLAILNAIRIQQTRF